MPPEPVDATTIFRSLYLAPDRRAFLEHVHGFTRSKLIFDFDPRAHDPNGVVADPRAAGWSNVELRPFLMPQRGTLPGPVQRIAVRARAAARRATDHARALSAARQRDGLNEPLN